MRERKVKIAGWGNTLSGKKIEFDGQTRYRLDKDETLLMLAVRSARKALERAAMDISDMDCKMCIRDSLIRICLGRNRCMKWNEELLTEFFAMTPHITAVFLREQEENLVNRNHMDDKCE